MDNDEQADAQYERWSEQRAVDAEACGRCGALGHTSAQCVADVEPREEPVEAGLEREVRR